MCGSEFELAGVVQPSRPHSPDLRYVSCMLVCEFVFNKNMCENTENTKCVAGASKSLFVRMLECAVVFAICCLIGIAFFRVKKE